MNDRYIKLFEQISSTIASLSEQILKNPDTAEKDKESAKIMKKYYLELLNKINSKSFSYKNFTKADFARLFIGAGIVTEQIENRLKLEETALKGYKEDLLPKLNEIVTSDKDDIIELIEKNFQ